MNCLRQVVLLFALFASIQGLDKCPKNVQTVDELDASKVCTAQVFKGYKLLYIFLSI